MRYFLICLVLLLSVSLAAQELSPFMNLRHSARDASGNVHFRFNSMDESLGNYGFWVKDTNWTEATLNQINPGEYEALVPYTPGSQIQYRVEATAGNGAEAITYMQPPFYSGTAFPPALTDLAVIGTDPTGDSLSIYAPVLDLTSSYVAANDLGLYHAVQNLAGAFPTMNSITSYNLWMSVIANPLALADSVAFAMIYTQNIFGIISPGLYKVGMDQSGVPSFERLGNIQSQVSGGTLYMACNWADLAADPQFGAWPNELNTLMLTDVSMNITITLPAMTPAFNFGDNGAIGMVEFAYHTYSSVSNQLPVGSWNSYNPVTGAYDISYTDADQDFPLVAQLVEFEYIDGSIIENYIDIAPSELDVENGIYRFTGIHNTTFSYYFKFSDNNIENVFLNAYVSNSDEVLPQPASLNCAVQNPLSRTSDSIEFTISGLAKSPLEISLFNLKGQRILQLPVYNPKQEVESFRWLTTQEFQALPSGLYFFRIKQDKRVETHKIMITR